MPHLSRGIPRYSKHKASGQAVVSILGEEFNLGPHGTKASQLEFGRQVAEWLARGQRARRASDITIIELPAAYLEFAQS